MKQNSKRVAPTAVLRRVVSYMLHYYRWAFILVILCILVSSVATVIGATFPQTLVDDYITPMIASHSTDFSGLAQALVRLVCLLALGAENGQFLIPALGILVAGLLLLRPYLDREEEKV